MNAFNTIMEVDPGSIFAVWSVFRVRNFCTSNCATWRTHSCHVIGTTFLLRISVLFLVFSFSYCEVVECGREKEFAMSERANNGSKTCRFVEAERVWNLGEWDKKAEYANCCGYGPRL